MTATARVKLEGQDEIAWVNYPGLKSSKYYDLSKKYLKNARPNYFYLNPITNQLEVIDNDLIANKEKSNMYHKIMNNKPSVGYLDFFKVDSQQILSLINKKISL